MMYKKKPVIIEAEIFTEESKDKVLSWAKEYQYNIQHSCSDEGKPILLIPTLEGEMVCCLGDYLIKGVQGEFYPCKPAIFKMTYNEVTT